MGEVEGFSDEFGSVLFDGFEDDFHIVDDVVAGDDDGFIEVIIVVFSEEETDVFSFVSGETIAVDEDASVETVRFALENEGAVGYLVNVGMLLDDL